MVWVFLRYRLGSKAHLSGPMWDLSLRFSRARTPLRWATMDDCSSVELWRLPVAVGSETHGGGGSHQRSLLTGPPPHFLPPRRQPNACSTTATTTTPSLWKRRVERKSVQPVTTKHGEMRTSETGTDSSFLYRDACVQVWCTIKEGDGHESLWSA